MIELPVTGRGFLIGVAVLLVGIIAVYATSMWTILLGAVVIAVIVYGVYLVGYRIDNALKNGF